LKVKRKLETGPTSEPTSELIPKSNEVIGLGGESPESNEKKSKPVEEVKHMSPEEFKSLAGKFDAFLEKVGKISPTEIQDQLTNSAQMAMGFKELDINCNLGTGENARAQEMDLTLHELNEEM